MANNTKKVKYGNYICKVKDFDIYMKCSYETLANGQKRVKNHDMCIYMAKKLVKNGFKTKEQAIDYINTLSSDFKVQKKRK